MKELTALNKKFNLIEDCLVLEENSELLGCIHCYMVKPEPTHNGFKIPKGSLVNATEKNSVQTVPKEIAINCWLCPHCGRLFKELLPDFEFIGVNNVSI